MRDLARIGALDALRRLLSAAAAQTAQLANISDLAAPFQLSRPTIVDYVTLLERLFLLQRLSPWHSNRLSRLIKTPKLHLGDSGLAAALLNVDAVTLADDGALYGQLLETFVLQELQRLASWYPDPLNYFHYRDKDQYEVDIVIEKSARAVAGIEVKQAPLSPPLIFADCAYCATLVAPVSPRVWFCTTANRCCVSKKECWPCRWKLCGQTHDHSENAVTYVGKPSTRRHLANLLSALSRIKCLCFAQVQR